MTEDDAEAVRWYQMAAEQGLAGAQSHSRYSCMPRVMGCQRMMLKPCAGSKWPPSRDMPEAQYILGLMYAKGDGVPEDDAKAYAWLSIAAAQGNESAKESKDIVTERMTRAQIADAQKLSREYWEAYGPNQENK